MSRRAQTDVAVLGALSVEPMTGYAMRAAIADTLGHFWGESFGQIYPTLARLEADGLVARDREGRTSGHTYRLTPAGRRRLVALLREDIPNAPPRNGTLLRLFFGRLLGPDACREVVAAALVDGRARVAHLTGVRAEVRADPDPNAPFWLMTVSAGLHAARAQVAWATETLAVLDELVP